MYGKKCSFEINEYLLTYTFTMPANDDAVTAAFAESE